MGRAKGNWLDRAVRAALIAPFAVGMILYGGSKRATVSYPQTEAGRAYLVDRGSYVTNDYVHIDFERRIVPDDAALVIERREVASTNDTDWAEVVRTTFAAFAVPTNLPCARATNWNWVVYADWAPPPTVHTNGILEVRWGTSRNDAAHRAAGLAVGVPAQSTAWRDGRMLGTPGGTNALFAAALISAGVDAITGATPLIGEAVQEEDPALNGSSQADTDQIEEEKKGSGE